MENIYKKIKMAVNKNPGLGSLPITDSQLLGLLIQQKQKEK